MLQQELIKPKVAQFENNHTKIHREWTLAEIHFLDKGTAVVEQSSHMAEIVVAEQGTAVAVTVAVTATGA